MSGGPDRGIGGPEHVETVAADRDDVFVGCGELRTERRPRRPSAAAGGDAEPPAGTIAAQIAVDLCLGQQLFEDQAVVTERLSDRIRQEDRIDRRLVGLGERSPVERFAARSAMRLRSLLERSRRAFSVSAVIVFNESAVIRTFAGNSNVGICWRIGSTSTTAMYASSGGAWGPGIHGTLASSARTTSASLRLCSLPPQYSGCVLGKQWYAR